MFADALYLAYLAQFDDAVWLRVVDRLGRAIHPVDQAATYIWFHLYPLRLQGAMDATSDPVGLAGRLGLEGRWRLAEQVQTSHRFLFGHRYWPDVRDAVVGCATGPDVPGSLDLAAQVQALAREVADRLRVDPSLLVGITAVALRTLQQVGLDRFEAAPRTVNLPPGALVGTADQVLATRARHGRRGLVGLLRGDARWTVTLDEHEPEARLRLVHARPIASAAPIDTRDRQNRDGSNREKLIPAPCRSASCGACWVGVLGGADRISSMDDGERQALADCGLITTSDERPVIRLACMARAYGAISLVIPPWRGCLKALAGRVE